MLPEFRYYAVKRVSNARWDVCDRQTGLVVVEALASKALAETVRSALCLAWRHGADAIKKGEVIM